MGYEVIDVIASLFFEVVGNPLYMGILISFVLVMVLLSLRANAVVILMAIIPVLLGFVLNGAGSNFIQVQTWVIVAVIMIAGFIFSAFFIFFQK